MTIDISADLSACERLTRSFYRCLDRHDVEQIIKMLAEECEWVRASGSVIGPDAMRKALDARDRSLPSRHLVANEIAHEAESAAIEVHFDLLYAAEGCVTPRVLSGFDRYIKTPQGWRLAFKRAELQF